MSIRGNLDTMGLPELLQWLCQGRKTGTLRLASGELEKRIVFDDGRIVSCASNAREEQLGSFLVRRGLIAPSDLERAIERQRNENLYLGKVLVSSQLLSEADLTTALRSKIEESVCQIFGWLEGSFEFLDGEVPDREMVPLSVDATAVVMEGLRRLDQEKPEPERAAPAQVALEDTGPLPLEDTAEVMAPPVEPVPVQAVDPTDTGEYRGVYRSSKPGSARRNAILGGLAVVLMALAVASSMLLRRSGVDEGGADGREASSDAAAGALVVSEVGATVSGTSDPPRLLEDRKLPEPPDPEENVSPPPPLLPARPVEVEREAAVAQRGSDGGGSAADAASRPAQTQTAGPAGAAAPEPASEAGQAAAKRSAAEGVQGGPAGPPSGEVTAQPSAGGRASPPAGSVGQPTRQPGSTGESAREPLPVQAAPHKPVEPGELVAPGPGVLSPQLRQRPQPVYPPAARRLGREAEVRLRVLVDEKGSVRDVEQAGPKAGLGFDRAAIEAARETVWQPATKGGVPVSMWVDLTIQFRL